MTTSFCEPPLGQPPPPLPPKPGSGGRRRNERPPTGSCSTTIVFARPATAVVSSVVESSLPAPRPTAVETSGGARSRTPLRNETERRPLIGYYPAAGRSALPEECLVEVDPRDYGYYLYEPLRPLGRLRREQGPPVDPPGALARFSDVEEAIQAERRRHRHAGAAAASRRSEQHEEEQARQRRLRAVVEAEAEVNDLFV